MNRLLLALVFLVLSTAGFSQDFNYTRVGVLYGQGDIEDIDFDTYSIAGSLAINNRGVFISGSYSNLDVDDFDVDLDTWSLGINSATSITDAIDFVIGVSWVDVEGRDGVGLDIGLRSWIAEGVELDVGISHVDLGDSSSETGIGASLEYYFDKNFSIGLSTAWTDDPSGSQYGIFGIYYFDN